MFSSPWAESKTLEERHAKLTKEMSSWPVNTKDPAKHVDKVQVKFVFNLKEPLGALVFRQKAIFNLFSIFAIFIRKKVPSCKNKIEPPALKI